MLSKRAWVWGLMILAASLATSGQAEAGLFSRLCPKPCCAPPPPVEVTLLVCHPCTGCKVPVTVCVPACCATEQPAVCSRAAIIGKQLTTFSYCCGYEVKVRWDHCGNPVVRTRG